MLLASRTKRCGVDISISIYFAAQGHWLSTTTQGTAEELDGILKMCHLGATARTYLQLPLQQWGAGNVYLLVLSS